MFKGQKTFNFLNHFIVNFLFFTVLLFLYFIFHFRSYILKTNQLIQSAKILLLPPKYEIIMLPSNHSFSNIAIAILDFSLLLLVNLSPLILSASFLVSVLCFFFIGFLSKVVIALPTIAIAIVVTLSRS